MPDIYHDFRIFAPPERVFEAISSPQGLDNWWTKRAEGAPVAGTTYALGFGSGYDWQATVRTCIAHAEIEWELTRADPDWLRTRVGLRLVGKEDATQVHFHHTGWAETNAHYRISSFCWAMYLRLLKRYVEHDEVVPYEKRLEV